MKMLYIKFVFSHSNKMKKKRNTKNPNKYKKNPQETGVRKISLELKYAQNQRYNNQTCVQMMRVLSFIMIYTLIG
jgi:hypothetical protein